VNCIKRNKDKNTTFPEQDRVRQSILGRVADKSVTPTATGLDIVFDKTTGCLAVGVNPGTWGDRPKNTGGVVLADGGRRGAGASLHLEAIRGVKNQKFWTASLTFAAPALDVGAQKSIV
jgi:hypothetical protein